MRRSSAYLTAGSVLLAFSMGASNAPGQGPVSAPPGAPALFAPVAAENVIPRRNLDASRREVIRTEFVSLDLLLVDEPAFLAARKSLDQGGAFPRFRISLFGEAPISVTMDMLNRSDDGTVSWAGRVDGQELSSVVIAVTGQVASGTIRTERGGLYRLRFVSPGVFAIDEVDASRFPPDRDPIGIDPTASPAATSADPVTAADDDGSMMDVLVVYTPAALDRVGGVAAMQNKIALAVTEANQSYANSGVIQRMRVVHSELVDYTERFDGNGDEIMNALFDVQGAADPYMTGVHALRDAYRADFVSVWINNETACALGYLMESESGAFQSYAFSAFSTLCDSNSFIRELGHNQGSASDRGTYPNAVRPFSYGFGRSSPTALRTLEASTASCGGGPCPAINYWSNPDILNAGAPIGIDGSLPNGADNRRSLNETRITAANWRKSLAPVNISIADASMNEGHTGTTLIGFNVTLSGAPLTPVTVNYATSAGTATVGTDFTSRSGTLTFAAGQTTRHVLVQVVGDSAVEPNETFNVTLTSPSFSALILDGAAVGTILNDDAPTAASPFSQYRLYSPITLEHLYTTDQNEYNVLGAQTGVWLQEGIGYKMLSSAGTFSGSLPNPFYRLYHAPSRQHHWTTDANEVMTLAAQTDWSYEGIIGFLLPTQVGSSIPLYRLVYPNPVIHLWTTDANEKQVLTTQQGWISEGIPGYVIP